MKMKMKNLVSAIIVGLLPSLATAGGHSGFGGHGTQVVVDSHAMEGTSGVLVRNVGKDVWIWDNPPEGFPAATAAECTQYIAFATGQQQPIGGTVTCRVVDGDGDVFLNTGTFQPNGTVLLTNVAATGKWAAYVGAQWEGKTDIQVDAMTSTYSFKPVN
jgi:hypothetical protein